MISSLIVMLLVASFAALIIYIVAGRTWTN
jgi:hypothetical protein